MSYHIWSVLAGLLATSTPTAPIVAEVRFNDGSLVKMTIQQPALEVMTKYGKLTIPSGDIRRIDIGRHLSPEMDKAIQQAVALLGSPSFKEREGAMRRLLKVGPLSYPFLKKATTSADLEVVARSTRLVKQLSDTYPSEELCRREEDVIHAADFPVVGHILGTIQAHSEYFKESALKLSDLRSVRLTITNSTELTVDAAKYGSEPNKWLDTGFNIEPRTRLVIKSDGQVDLWPTGPGQYMTGPKGYTTAGKGGTFMAGALIGRIGPKGKPFVIGDRYDGTPAEEGKLYLHIVPSPWNNASTGNYKVRISTDFASIAR